jgi:hypothetical protein
MRLVSSFFLVRHSLSNLQCTSRLVSVSMTNSVLVSDRASVPDADAVPVPVPGRSVSARELRTVRKVRPGMAQASHRLTRTSFHIRHSNIISSSTRLRSVLMMNDWILEFDFGFEFGYGFELGFFWILLILLD